MCAPLQSHLPLIRSQMMGSCFVDFAIVLLRPAAHWEHSSGIVIALVTHGVHHDHFCNSRSVLARITYFIALILVCAQMSKWHLNFTGWPTVKICLKATQNVLRFCKVWPLRRGFGFLKLVNDQNKTNKNKNVVPYVYHFCWAGCWSRLF